MRLRRVAVVVAAAALAAVAAAGSAGADRSNDQQIAKNSVLTTDDVPGFRSVTPAEDSPLPPGAVCRALEQTRKQLNAAPNTEVEFRTSGGEQVVNNQVSVLSSTKRAKRALAAYRSPTAADCLGATFRSAITAQDPSIDVDVDVRPVTVAAGDGAAAYDLHVTATGAGSSQDLYSSIAVVRVGRSLGLFGFGDTSAPVPADVAAGLVKLVTQRLEEAQ
jgi:hypothetical protein